MKRNPPRLIAGLILLIMGAALFTYGIVAYNNERASIGGSIQRIFNGSSAGEKQAIIEMIGGGALVAIGLVLMLVRQVRRR
ncbi:MAG: DUF3185 family protein [Spirochaetia bacterium]|jgi:hypothetical protein